jgi:hypothetical protein
MVMLELKRRNVALDRDVHRFVRFNLDVVLDLAAASR